MSEILSKRIMISSLLLMAMMFLMPSSASAAGVSIDNFNDIQEVCDPTTPCGSSASSKATTAAIGGQRDIKVTRTAGANDVSAESANAGDYFTYSADVFTQGNWQVVWDGDSDPNAISYTGLGSVDLTDSNTNTGIYFLGVHNDLAFTLRIEIYTDQNNWSYGEIPISANSFEGSYGIDFTSFVQGGTGPANFGDVGAIVLTHGGSPVTSLDFSVDYIGADASTPTAVALSGASASIDPLSNWVVWAVLGLLSASSGVILFRKRCESI